MSTPNTNRLQGDSLPKETPIEDDNLDEFLVHFYLNSTRPEIDVAAEAKLPAIVQAKAALLAWRDKESRRYFESVLRTWAKSDPDTTVAQLYTGIFEQKHNYRGARLTTPTKEREEKWTQEN